MEKLNAPIKEDTKTMLDQPNKLFGKKLTPVGCFHSHKKHEGSEIAYKLNKISLINAALATSSE